mmetsp:Transcript_56103/g.89296  ORF Transcript_56103/g.89296 Transcript_56103/m.89296 type:complete len:250 (-) Transcript_56103:497-1246(-)
MYIQQRVSSMIRTKQTVKFVNLILRRLISHTHKQQRLIGKHMAFTHGTQPLIDHPVPNAAVMKAMRASQHFDLFSLLKVIQTHITRFIMQHGQILIFRGICISDRYIYIALDRHFRRFHQMHFFFISRHRLHIVCHRTDFLEFFRLILRRCLFGEKMVRFLLINEIPRRIPDGRNLIDALSTSPHCLRFKVSINRYLERQHCHKKQRHQRQTNECRQHRRNPSLDEIVVSAVCDGTLRANVNGDIFAIL